MYNFLQKKHPIWVKIRCFFGKILPNTLQFENWVIGSEMETHSSIYQITTIYQKYTPRWHRPRGPRRLAPTSARPHTTTTTRTKIKVGLTQMGDDVVDHVRHIIFKLIEKTAFSRFIFDENRSFRSIEVKNVTSRV